MKFGESLQALRKEAKVTQEQLATHLGVSAQAVSKWENGSYPDGDLLPRIADYFGVSIDYLYGRQDRSVSMEKQVVTKFGKIWDDVRNGTPQDDGWRRYVDAVKRLVWCVEIGAWANNESEYFDCPYSEEKISRTASAVVSNISTSFMSLVKDKEFFLFLPQPTDAEGYEKWFRDTDDARKLFAFLADRDNLDVVTFLYSLRQGEFASSETIARQAGVPKEKVDSALEYLCSIGGRGSEPVRQMNILDINGNNSGAYGTYISLASLIIGMFALADFYVHTPQGYNMQVTCRDKSWFDRAKLREFRKNRSEKAGESQ
ncbi:MAG: helix-turn-helix domain-containing protein [Lachnospiraceae bacterium]|nr:helix-turn-helix domain-containing protein [Lachnospiraceae bacterium]